MKREKLKEALNEISDRHIKEATERKRRPWWIGTVAAALAVVLFIFAISQPMAIRAKAVSLPEEIRVMGRPDLDDYDDRELWKKDLDLWNAERESRSASAAAALDTLSPFFAAGSAQFLTGSQENMLWSPANAYIGLAMLAELTDGNSQQQLLSLLGSKDLDTLHNQVSALWETVYMDNGNEICTLANSLWLEDSLNYHKDTIENLSYYHYASIYKGDLGTKKIDKAIGAWLNNNTGGLLKSATDTIQLDPQTVLALYSTLYFQSKWTDEFNASNNTNSTFHAPSGDRDVTFMNRKLAMMNYYWGNTFGAVSLTLKNGSQMWFILPDEGLTTQDVLKDGQYMDMLLTAREWENTKFMKVNLSVPKFDVSAAQDLREGLEALGVRDIFSLENADFTAITGDVPVFITAANQALRVQVDEQGVKAAVYIEFPGATSPAPPDEIIDFDLDRPFLFAITNDRVPLIAGVVNEP